MAPPDSGWFEELLLTNLLVNVDAHARTQLQRPFNSENLQVAQTGPAADTAPARNGLNWLPFVITIAVLIPLFTSGGYLFQSLVQEKSNRVIEILLLSLRPRQLLGGKLLGFGALTLVQYTIWGAIGSITWRGSFGRSCC